MPEQKFQDEIPSADHDSSPKLVQELAFGMFESLLNAAIEHDDDLQEQVRARNGLVVRIKTTDPQLTAYLLFTEHGIEISPKRTHSAQVRMNCSLLSLLSVALGQRDLSHDQRIRLWGDSEAIEWFVSFAQEINARTAIQRWLSDHVNITDLWQKIRRNDLSWLSDLMPMPAMLREALSEIRALKTQLETQETLLSAHSKRWQEQRQWDLGAALVVLLAMLISVIPGETLAAQIQSITKEQVIAVGLGVALLTLRVWRR